MASDSPAQTPLPPETDFPASTVLADGTPPETDWPVPTQLPVPTVSRRPLEPIPIVEEGTDLVTISSEALKILSVSQSDTQASGEEGKAVDSDEDSHTALLVVSIILIIACCRLYAGLLYKENEEKKRLRTKGKKEKEEQQKPQEVK
jgi:hypothetical protein